MGQKPSIEIRNNLPKDIKIKIDHSRNFTKLTRVDNDKGSKLPEESTKSTNDDPHENEVFYLIENNNFITIDRNRLETFRCDGNRNEHAFLTILTQKDNKAWSVYCESHPIMRHSLVFIEEKGPKNLSLAPNSVSSNSWRLKKKGGIYVHNESSKKIWIRIDTDDLEETKKTLIRSVENSADSTNYTVRDQVHCKPQQGQGYTRIDEWRSTYFFLNIPKNTIYISIDYELEYEPLSGKLEKHCVHHPIQYWTKDTKLFPRIVINEFNNGIMFSVERSTVNKILQYFYHLFSSSSNPNTSVEVKNNLSKPIKVTVSCSKTLVKLHKVNNSKIPKVPEGSLIANDDNSFEYEVFCTVPTENSFTKMDPEQLAIFNPDNSRGDYAFLTVWIENDDKSWSVYCQNHPIPKSSQILVGQEGSEIPTLSICSTSKSKPSKSSESALIKFSNNSEKKIWVKINNDNQETSFEDNIGFISDYATENLVYYRAHQGNDYTEIDKGESTSFFLDISKHRISINYKTLSGELKQYPITDLIQYWNKDTGYLSEIEIRNSGEAIRHSIRRQKK